VKDPASCDGDTIERASSLHEDESSIVPSLSGPFTRIVVPGIKHTPCGMVFAQFFDPWESVRTRVESSLMPSCCEAFVGHKLWARVLSINICGLAELSSHSVVSGRTKSGGCRVYLLNKKQP
jgi:hypothetical protein